MIIFVDGPDGTGKTTFLSSKENRIRVPFTGNREDNLNQYVLTAKPYAIKDEKIYCDRSFLANFFYRNPLTFDVLLRTLEELEPFSKGIQFILTTFQGKIEDHPHQIYPPIEKQAALYKTVIPLLQSFGFKVSEISSWGDWGEDL